MSTRNQEAELLEKDYFIRLTSALSGHEEFEINEIIQGVQEHIEESLAEFSDAEITLVQMAKVIEQLGPPELYAQDDSPGTTNIPKKLPIAAFVTCLVVFAASFMNWGSFQTNPNKMFGNMDFPAPLGSNSNLATGTGSFHDNSITISGSAWNSTISLLGVSIPCWILIINAIVLLCFSALKSMDIYVANHWAFSGLALYGIFHTSFYMYFLVRVDSNHGKVGIGSILTLIAFAFLLVLLLTKEKASSNVGIADDSM